MYVIGLDGKRHKFLPKSKRRKNASQLHIRCRELLKEIMPQYKILEEVALTGCKPILYADFYIPVLTMVVEVHGQQHFEYNSHFFKTKAAFNRAKKRDRLKREWCEINDIEMVELNYNEDNDEWRDKIEYC